MTDYSIYDSLSSSTTLFRLLVLHPASNSDQPIRCHLLTTGLDAKPDFEALSYCWGDSADTIPISVCDKPFEATATLNRALRGLRLDDTDRVLWVDAVCINQSNLVEKNHQVPLMSRIYGEATAVVVWLDIDSDCADLLKEFHKCDYHWDSRKNPAGVVSVTSDPLSLLLRLKSFFQSSWWTRVWTVQELLLAKAVRFYFDDLVELSESQVFSVSESFLRHVADCCRGWDSLEHVGVAVDVSTLAHGMFRRVKMIKDAIEQHRDPNETRKHGVPKLANMFRYRQATNPRDKLYGFLGVDSDLESPPIDYRKPISECYAALTAFIMHRTSNLDVLNFVEPKDCDDDFRRISSQPTTGLPSWCPDWNDSVSYSMEGRLRLRDFIFHHFNASMGIPPRVYIPQGTNQSLFDGMSEENNRILVLGLEIDTVRCVGDYYGKSPASRPEIWRSWRRLVDSEMLRLGNDATERDLMRAFSRTVCQGFAGFSFQNGRMVLINLHDDHDAFFEELWADEGVGNVPKTVKGDSDSRQLSLGARSLGHAAITESSGRRFFITEKGKFGMGFPNIQSGDGIWILSGGRTPYILQRAAQDLQLKEGTIPIYEFAGQAYVDGFMYGEAVENAADEDGRLALERILLS